MAVMVQLPPCPPGGQPTQSPVGKAVTRVVLVVMLGLVVHPGTTWVVRSVGGSGETVTVRVVVLVEPDGQEESLSPLQVTVLGKV